MNKSLAIKLKQSYPTEIYISQAGYLCIKQDQCFGDEEDLVMLSPDQLALFFEFYKKNCDEIEASWTGSIEEDSK